MSGLGLRLDSDYIRVGLQEWSVHMWSVHRWSVLRAVVILRGAAPSHFSSSCNHTCMRVTHCSQYPTYDSWLHLQFMCARSVTQYSIQRQSEIVSKRLLNVNRNEKFSKCEDP